MNSVTSWMRARFDNGRPSPAEVAEEHVASFATDHEPTPIYVGQRTRLVLLAAMVVGIILLANQAPNVPRLLLVGATVALILSFPVRLLSRFMPRGLAILIVVASTITIATIAVIAVIPFAVSEISRFIAALPDTADSVEDVVRDVLMEFYRRGWMRQHPDVVIEDFQARLFDRGEVIAEDVLGNVVTALTRTFSLLIGTFGVIFVATYLLIDIPRFKEKFIFSFSPAYRDDAAQLWATLGDSLSRYLAGLSISIIIQGAMATIGLALLDVPYAVVLGIWMSITAILPYVGAFLGAIPSILIALTISWEMAIVVALLYVVINQVEGNVITPRIQGNAVRVHPLLIFMAVLGGSEIAGPLGAILAVPTLAVTRVLIQFLFDRVRIRGAQETVLVALGGDDDAEEREEHDGDVRVAVTHKASQPGDAKEHDDVHVEITHDAPQPGEVPTTRDVTVRVSTASRRVPTTTRRVRPAIRRARRIGASPSRTR